MKTKEISVTQATLSDISDLAELFDGYRQFYGKASDVAGAREFLLARFNHGESTLFIAREGNSAVGFAQLYPGFSSVSMARTFILNDLYVRPQSRRNGAARLLLESAVAFGKTLGAVRLTLTTAITNSEAQALYQAAGWKKDENFFVFHHAIEA